MDEVDKLMRKLSAAIKRRFRGATPELEHVRPVQKVGGFLIWSGFEGADQIDRQRQLRTAIDEELTAEERLRVTTILTLTPDEAAVMRSPA